MKTYKDIIYLAHLVEEKEQTLYATKYVANGFVLEITRGQYEECFSVIDCPQLNAMAVYENKSDLPDQDDYNLPFVGEFIDGLCNAEISSIGIIYGISDYYCKLCIGFLSPEFCGEQHYELFF